MASNKEWHAPSMYPLSVIPFKPRESVSSSLLHPYLSRLDKAILNGQACAAKLYPFAIVDGTQMSSSLMSVLVMDYFYRLFSKSQAYWPC